MTSEDPTSPRSQRPSFSILLGTLLLSPTAAHAGLSLGQPIERAAALHITQGGLSHLGDAVEKMVPPTIPVKDFEGEFACAETDLRPLQYSLAAMEARISADNVDISATKGRLDVTLSGTLGSSATTFVVSGDCAVLTGLNETCDVQLPTTALTARLGMQLQVVDGLVDATVDQLLIEMSPIGNPVQGCSLESAIGTLLGQNEYAINNLLMSFIEPEIEGVGAEIETAIESALNGLVLETDLPLGELVLHLSITPSRLELGDQGIIVGLGGVVTGAKASDCVDASTGSAFTDAPWPLFDEQVPGSSLSYDAAILINKDFTDHLLWAIWASGMLCMDLEDLQGAPLTTGLLGSFLGPEFTELFPQDQPARIHLDPALPPTTLFDDDDPPLRVQVQDLGIDIATRLAERDLRLLRIEVDADAGLSVGIAKGTITPALSVDPNAFLFNEIQNEFLPPHYSDGLRDMIPELLSMFLPEDLLGSFVLPDLMGLDLGAVVWQPSLEDRWQGAYILLDSSAVEPLDIGGCEGGSLGCGEEDTGGGGGLDLGLGCDEGKKSKGGCGESSSGSCSSWRAPRSPRLIFARLSLLVGLITLASLRRRP